MKIIASLVLLLSASSASARLSDMWRGFFFSPVTCESALESQGINMVLKDLIDPNIFEEGLDFKMNSSLQVENRTGRLRVQVGNTFYGDKHGNYSIAEKEPGLFVLSFKDQPFLKIDIEGDIARVYSFENRKWQLFAKFTDR